MKVCVTSTGPELDSEIDPLFGRCKYFLFVDPESLELEAVENPNFAVAEGAGIQSAQLVAKNGVDTIITGQVGPNAFSVLRIAGVKILVEGSGKVREAVEKYKRGEFVSFAQGPTVQRYDGVAWED
jgi:predicted Fe-Mo cluster-binding NifX family protein